MKTNTSSLPLRLRKWIIASAFIGFLIGLGIGAYVAHKQHTTADSAKLPAIPEASK